MTSTGVEKLEFDTEQRHRFAHVLPKLPSAADKSPQTSQNTGQEAGLVSENHGQAGFGAIMLRKMVGDGRRPKANGEIPVSIVLVTLVMASLCGCAHLSDQTNPLLPIYGNATDDQIESSIWKLKHDDVIDWSARARNFAGAKRSQKYRDSFQTKINNFKNHVLEVHSAIAHSKADEATRKKWHEQVKVLAATIDQIEESEHMVNNMADEDEKKK